MFQIKIKNKLIFLFEILLTKSTCGGTRFVEKVKSTLAKMIISVIRSLQ